MVVFTVQSQHEEEELYERQDADDSQLEAEQSSIPQAIQTSFEVEPAKLPLPDSLCSLQFQPKELNWQEQGLEVVLFEGSVMKFKPGLSQLYVSRWLQLTTTELRYYKNQLSANCWLTKPLSTVPLESIRDVSRSQASNIKEAKPVKPFQFEVFIKREDHSTTLSRAADGSVFAYKEALHITLSSNSNAIEKGRLMKRPSRTESPEKRTNSYVASRTSTDLYSPSSWSIRELQWYAAEKRLLFAVETVENLQQWVHLIKLALQKQT